MLQTKHNFKVLAKLFLLQQKILLADCLIS